MEYRTADTEMKRFGISEEKVVLWYDVVDYDLFNSPAFPINDARDEFPVSAVALIQDDFVLAYDIVTILIQSLDDEKTEYSENDFEQHMRILFMLEDYAPVCRRIFEKMESASNDNRRGVLFAVHSEPA